MHMGEFHVMGVQGFDMQRSIVDVVEKSRKVGRAFNADLLVNKSKIAGFSQDHCGVMPGLPCVRPAEIRCGHACRGPALRALAKIIKMAIHQYEPEPGLRSLKGSS